MKYREIKIKRALNQIIGLDEIYRPTYPLNFVEDISDNDEIYELDIAGSVEKELRYLFSIYMKVLYEYEAYRNDNIKLYNALISNELEHFILRFPVILDILNKHFLSLINNAIKDIEEVIPFDTDIIRIKKIRNEIVHHGAGCLVRSDIKAVSFKIFLNRTTIIKHLPNEVWISQEVDGYNCISSYLTWMLCLLLNYLDDFFKEANRLRTKGMKISNKHISEVDNSDEINSYVYSRLILRSDELNLYKNNLEKLLIDNII